VLEFLLVLLVAAICFFVGFVFGAGEECACRSDPDLVEVMRTLQTLEHLDLVSVLAQQDMWQAARDSLDDGEQDQGTSES
jgi:hypothetical protein